MKLIIKLKEMKEIFRNFRRKTYDSDSDFNKIQMKKKKIALKIIIK